MKKIFIRIITLLITSSSSLILTGWNCYGEGGLTTIQKPANSKLGSALENTSLKFTTSGDAHWNVDNTVTMNTDNPTVRSGVISANQESSLHTVVSVPQGETRTLSYWWMVSSEYIQHNLILYINDIEIIKISGAREWENRMVVLYEGTNEITWKYIKNDADYKGSDAGWLEQIRLENPAVTVVDGRVLDNSNLTFSGSGEADWVVDTIETVSSRNPSARSGSISHSQQSTLNAVVSVPAGQTRKLSFKWKVSSESLSDRLEFWTGSTYRSSISGIKTWEDYTLEFTQGTYNIRWTYIKDPTTSAGTDAGWIDQVKLETPVTLSNMAGTWTTGPVVDGTNFYKLTYVITDNTLVMTREQYYYSFAFFIGEGVLTGSIDIGSLSSTDPPAASVDLIQQSFLFTLKNESAKETFNSENYFGYSDWITDDPKNIAGRSDTPDNDTWWNNNDAIETLVQIDGNKMKAVWPKNPSTTRLTSIYDPGVVLFTKQ